MLLIINGINKKITKETERPTSKPLVMPPSKYEKVSSYSDNGGIKTSTIFPWTFDIRIDDEVLAKEFCIIAIQMSPGARNSENE